MSQYRTAVADKIENKIRELDKNWDWGQPVKMEVLNEIFGNKFDVLV